MFDDPQKYLQTFANTVASCGLISDLTFEAPHISRSWEQWQIITVGLKCKFHSGERLEVFEGYSRKNLKKSIQKNLSYQFMQADGSLIFRIDTHGIEISPEGACHLHIDGEQDLVLEGNARLNGFSLRDVNFLTVFPIVYDRVEGRALPWERTL